MHLEPVEDAALDRLDQVARLALRLLERVAADERGALEDDVVELARVRVVRADRADERARLQPLAAQHRIARGRDGDDDVLRGGVAVALGRLGAGARAEGGEPVGRAAVGDDALDRRHGRADAGDLAPPASRSRSRRASRARTGEVPRRDAARGAGAQLAERSASITADELGLARRRATTTKRAPSAAT